MRQAPSHHPVNQDGEDVNHANLGYGPQLSFVDVGLTDSLVAINPETAFWSLVPNTELTPLLNGSHWLSSSFREKEPGFREEMEKLRFQVNPSAVYLNPTDRCNLDCDYCYIPGETRRSGTEMNEARLFQSLEALKNYFTATLPAGVIPQVIFHGSEPLLAKEAVFAAIERFAGNFRFGIQTNATLLDEQAINFLVSRGVSIGLSLDAHLSEIADAARKGWNGGGIFNAVQSAVRRLIGYPGLNVISTVTKLNVSILSEMVEYFHGLGLRSVLLNPVRCTREGGRNLKPDNLTLAREFIRALDRSYELYRETGRKLVIGNFANVLTGIAAPTARKLMCDLSPCGGGRCFFAVSAQGEVFPCSEFIGFPEFSGGSLFEDEITNILGSSPFRQVTGRKIENIHPCGSCAIRHFCGAPCPAEIHAHEGRLDAPSTYCEFYQEQVRYAFRLIELRREDAYLWDNWKEETKETFSPSFPSHIPDK